MGLPRAMPLWLALGGVLAGVVAASGCGAKAELPLPWDDAQLAARAQDPARVAEGRRAFSLHCTACHGLDGHSEVGMLGPSLVDAEWLHGERPTEIYRTIAVGVVSRGMQSWRHLGDERVADLTAYVLSLQ